MEQSRNMKQHVTLVGALHVGFGILGLLGALAIYLTFDFVYQFVEEEPYVKEMFEFIGSSLAIIILFISVLGIIGGIGLFSYKPWSRILVMIVSAINCLNVPVGTAKGVYSIWVLMQPETIDMFDANG